jgi:tRNA(fMet)-specific endonuclease VapC
MKYLLDTNVCIRYLNRRSTSIINNMEIHPPSDIVVCIIVEAELYYGAMNSDNPEHTLAEKREFLQVYETLPFDRDAALNFGRIRTSLKKQGTPIGPYDLMIAAIALTNNLILVTHNTREFGRVSGLRVEDWETS